MPDSNSPISDINEVYEVYFEVADQVHSLAVLQQSSLASHLAAGVRQEKYGFHLNLTNPVIPEVIKLLVGNGIEIYQVRRQPKASDIGYMI